MDSTTSVSDWTESVRLGVGQALQSVAAHIPSILGAIVVLLIGVVVAYVLKAVVVRVLQAIKVKPLADKVGLKQVFPGQYDVAELLGDLVKWFFIIVFLLQALTIANLLEVQELVHQLLAYVPHVLAAAAVIFVGAVVADLTGRVVTNAAHVMGGNTARMMAAVAKYSIWVLVGFTVLAQLGVNTLFLDRLFTAFVVMLALAGGLAFGLGGQDAAKSVIADMRANFKRD